MKTQKVDRQWFKAKLMPAARGLFTASFYPEPKPYSGAQYIYFAEATPNVAHKKVILASKLEASGLRIVTSDLAVKCLMPGGNASCEEMSILNGLSAKLKV